MIPLSSFSDFVKIWVGFGSFTGAMISGFDKLYKISNEPTPNYKNDTIEKPISVVYNITRIAGSAGLGAFIAGTTALTAPISVPLYIMWKNKDNEKNKEP